MSETLMPSVIFIATFILVSSLLIAGLGSVVNLSLLADHPDDPETIIGGDPFNNIAFEVSPDNQITDSDILECTNAYMTESELDDYQTTYSHPTGYTQRDVACYVVRNATAFPNIWKNMRIEEPGMGNYILMYQSKREFLPAMYSYTYSYITLGMISEHLQNATSGYNYSDVPFKTYDWFTARFWVDNGEDLMDQVYANDYNLTVGLCYNSSIGSMSPWSMVAKFLTFSLPNVDPYINLLMAIPVWFCIGFLCLMVISRFIPTVGGG